jgi:hypothetical protein
LGWTDYDEEQLRIFWARKQAKEEERSQKDGEQTLVMWIRKLSEEATGREQAHAALLSEIEGEIEILKMQTGIGEVSWESDWTLSHSRGAVMALRRVLGLSPCSPRKGIVPALSGKAVRFGNGGTFLAMDGSFHFGCDDVPEDWLRLIRGATGRRISLLFQEVSTWEDRLSRVLGGVKVESTPSTPTFLQLHWVRTLTERLRESDFAPKVYTGSDLTVVVKSESDGYFLSSNGEIHIPFNCTPTTLGDFLSGNAAIAKSLGVRTRRIMDSLETAREQCMLALSVKDITWDSVLNVDDLISCLDLLAVQYSVSEKSGEEPPSKRAESNVFRDKRLHVSSRREFSVLPDGRISVPINWIH